MDKAKKFFKDLGFYLSSNFFSNILNLITGIVVRRLLQPAAMGLFSELMLIFEYGRYSHLGIIDSMDRELPYFYGAKDQKRFDTAKDAGFTLCMISVFLMSICLFCASFFVGAARDRVLVNGIRIVSIMVILRLFNSLYIVLNRARNNFSVISKYTILVAFLDMAAKIALIIKFGLYGLLWASALTWFLGLVYFYKASEGKFKFMLRFPLDEASRLFKIGFPIFIMGFVFITLTNIDRIMIIRLLGRESLGFYTIALMVSAYVTQLPSLIYAVFFPRFYQAYGEKKDILKVKEFFIKPIMVFAYLFPIFIGVIVILLPLLVRHLLPAYMPGLFPAYILLLGSSFIALVNMPHYLLIALNKQPKVILIGAFCIVIGAALNYMLVKVFDLGLVGIAVGTSLAYFVYMTALVIYAFKNYSKAFLSHCKFFANIYFPFVWVLLLLLLFFRMFIVRVTGRLFEDSIVVFCQLIAFVLCCAPLILYANKKTEILTMLKNAYLEKRKK